MNDLFDTLEDYLPAFLFLAVWLAVLPVRVLVLVSLPMGAAHSWHKLNKVQRFFAFREN